MEPFAKVVMVGIGLINGSLAKVLRREGLAREIMAVARNQATLDRALDLGLCDTISTDAADAVADADLVVLGTPPAAMGKIAAQIGPVLPQKAILTDVGSYKTQVVGDVLPHLNHPERFVPGHPIAGTEHSGPDAAFDTLFINRPCVLTPLPETDPAALARIEALWQVAGSKVDCMTPEHHDKILAITSHLPHLIAYTIVGTVANLEDQAKSEVFKYSAGGFTDFTRIAGSDPTMWRDVFLNNKEAVLEMLQRFQEDLFLLQRAIRWDEGQTLFDLFTRTRAIRRGVVQAGQAYVRQPDDPLASKP